MGYVCQRCNVWYHERVNRNHIVRAVLESIAYQTRDVLSVMQEDSDTTLSYLKADGELQPMNF